MGNGCHLKRPSFSVRGSLDDQGIWLYRRMFGSPNVLCIATSILLGLQNTRSVSYSYLIPLLIPETNVQTYNNAGSLPITISNATITQDVEIPTNCVTSNNWPSHTQNQCLHFWVAQVSKLRSDATFLLSLFLGNRCSMANGKRSH